MNLVFGGTFICEDNDTAKRISAGNQPFACVTLLGDTYRTDGVLGGGANTNGNRILQIQNFLDGERETRKNN